jgi:hypothetical protein
MKNIDKQVSKQSNKQTKNMTIKIKICRYDFSPDMENKLREFARIHQYDERKQLKENWQKWQNQEENCKAIAAETSRLVNIGYTGDVIIKMFTSIRYYYMKKNARPKLLDEEEKPRKNYVSCSPMILEIIDNHVHHQIESFKEGKVEEEEKICQFVPAKLYLDFCKKHPQEILNEIKLLKDYMDQEDIILKLKKTYKNRYQTIKSKLKNSK